jgi:hypothetical protein
MLTISSFLASQNEIPVRAVLCSAHGSTRWYGIIPEYKIPENGGRSFFSADDISPDTLLALCDDVSSSGIRYVKVVGDSRRVYPKVVSYVSCAREKVPEGLREAMGAMFGEEADRWGRKGV